MILINPTEMSFYKNYDREGKNVFFTYYITFFMNKQMTLSVFYIVKDLLKN